MAVLTEGQWDLDGYVFGERTPVRVLMDGLDYGAAALRTDDKPRQGADGIAFGRDYVDGPEMMLTLGVIDDSDVWHVLGELSNVWRPPSRLVPGATSTLRYMRNGQVVRFVGRPRKFGIKPASVENHTLQQVEVSFQLASAFQYLEGSTSSNSARLQLLATNEGGGVTFPVTFPVIWSGGKSTRFNTITVNSAAPTPFVCTIHGPATGTLTGIRVSGAGWAVETSASLAWDQTMVIDTRAQTITRDGVNIPGTLTRDSTLKGQLTPGQQTLTFHGTDPSNTAYAVFEWFDALPL